MFLFILASVLCATSFICNLMWYQKSRNRSCVYTCALMAVLFVANIIAFIVERTM